MSATSVSPAQGPLCPNCGSKNLATYCPQCGQRAPIAADYSLWLLIKNWALGLVSYDGRGFATVRALLFRPGLLTREYFDGRRAKYVGPFRIFVLANVALWFVSPYLGIYGFSLERAKRYVVFSDFWSWALGTRAVMEGISVEKLIARIDAVSSSENTAAVLCLSPIFAVGLTAVMSRRGYSYVQHLIFATHFFCIQISILVFTWGVLCIPLYVYLLKHPELPLAQLWVTGWKSPWTQHFVLVVPLYPYVFLALRRAYSLTTREAAWRAGLMISSPWRNGRSIHSPVAPTTSCCARPAARRAIWRC